MTTVPRDAGNHIPPTSHVEALGGQTSFLIKSPHKNDEASGSNQRELLAIRRERELFVGEGSHTNKGTTSELAGVHTVKFILVTT